MPPTLEVALALYSNKPHYLVIGPGPGHPEDLPINQNLIAHLGKSVPILGICLGHQAIATAFGAKVIRAIYPMHGKSCQIHHSGTLLFHNVDSPLTVGRYHSLVVEPKSLPSCFHVTAKTELGEIMALEHKSYPIFGVQFHPDSFLSPFGNKIFMNFLHANGVVS